jgi:hypothetical protein
MNLNPLYLRWPIRSQEMDRIISHIQAQTYQKVRQQLYQKVRGPVMGQVWNQIWENLHDGI